MRKRILACLLIGCLVLCTLSGCAYETTSREEVQPEQSEEIEDVTESTENPPAKQYQEPLQRPDTTPNILVSRGGYQDTDTKIALFLGEELPQTFTVRERESKEVVYTGTIQAKQYNAATHTYVSEGDFSQLTDTGEYYIEAAVVGRSYSFTVERGLYERLYEENMEALLETEMVEEVEQCIKQPTVSENTSTQVKALVEETCETMSYLLFAYDFYEKETGESIQQNTKTPPVLTMAAQELEQLLTLVQEEEITHQEAGKLYVAVMAQFADLYESYDRSLSGQCLKSAESVYRTLAKEQTTEDIEADFYYAAAQLYKTTGTNTYHLVIKNYLKSEPAEEKWDILGDVVYLTTSNKVDQSSCEVLMEQLLTQAEQISASAQKDAYLASWDTQQILQNMMVLSIVDYVIVSHEYLGILKENMHFLSGRNPACVIEEYTLPLQSALLFILGDMVEREENV